MKLEPIINKVGYLDVVKGGDLLILNLKAGLTPSEEEIADWLADGFAKKEIANELGKSIRTVENLTNSVYKKIGIQKVSELTKWWFMTRFSISQYEIEAKKRALQQFQTEA